LLERVEVMPQGDMRRYQPLAHYAIERPYARSLSKQAFTAQGSSHKRAGFCISWSMRRCLAS
jgi:hypothetical protein